jgi:hypothetical protein
VLPRGSVRSTPASRIAPPASLPDGRTSEPNIENRTFALVLRSPRLGVERSVQVPTALSPVPVRGGRGRASSRVCYRSARAVHSHLEHGRSVPLGQAGVPARARGSAAHPVDATSLSPSSMTRLSVTWPMKTAIPAAAIPTAIHGCTAPRPPETICQQRHAEHEGNGADEGDRVQAARLLDPVEQCRHLFWARFRAPSLCRVCDSGLEGGNSYRAWSGR